MLMGIVPQAKVLTFQGSPVFSSLFPEWIESFCLPSQETLFPLTYFFASIKFLHTLCIPFPYCCSKYDTSLSFLSTNVGTVIWASWVHFFNRKKRKDKKNPCPTEYFSFKNQFWGHKLYWEWLTRIVGMRVCKLQYLNSLLRSWNATEQYKEERHALCYFMSPLVLKK